MELEHARDDLTYELHKIQQSNVQYEINVTFYFLMFKVQFFQR